MFRAATATILLLAAGADAAAGQTGTVGPAHIPGASQEQKLDYIATALKKMDVNNDRRITAAEWTAAGGKIEGFNSLDHNRDGILTLQELRSNAAKLKAFEDFKAAPAI